MKSPFKLLAGIALACVLALSPAVLAEDDADDEMEGAKNLEAYVKAATSAKVTLIEAIKTAIEKTGGTALDAGFEIDDGKPVFEVVLWVGGDDAHLVEVEVDAMSGKVLEVEREDAEDDDDDEDEDDDQEE